LVVPPEPLWVITLLNRERSDENSLDSITFVRIKLANPGIDETMIATASSA
jgi:hypothetical protein